MASVRILGVDVPVAFPDGGQPLDEQAILACLEAMAALIDGVSDWSDEEREAFRGMRRIAFFEGEVIVNGWPLSRPGCDEDDAVFYWEAGEFMRNTDPDVHANTFFHDCWHVMQFKARGDFARDEQERVDREIDAINRQIAVAAKLGCDDREIQFLRDFCADQNRIMARLKEGVGARMLHQDEVGQA